MTDEQTVEEVAIALWVQDAAGAAPNVAKIRNRETWNDQCDKSKTLWSGQARAAIVAMQPALAEAKAHGLNDAIEAAAYKAETKLNKSQKHTLAQSIGDAIRALKKGSDMTDRKRAHPADGMTHDVRLGDGAVASIINPLSFSDGGPEWVMRYGNPTPIRFAVAGLLESYDYLLSSNINMTEATRRLRLMRAARKALIAQEGET